MVQEEAEGRRRGRGAVEDRSRMGNGTAGRAVRGRILRCSNSSPGAAVGSSSSSSGRNLSNIVARPRGNGRPLSRKPRRRNLHSAADGVAPSRINGPRNNGSSLRPERRNRDRN